jgi:hypothetical protein
MVGEVPASWTNRISIKRSIIIGGDLNQYSKCVPVTGRTFSIARINEILAVFPENLHVCLRVPGKRIGIARQVLIVARGCDQLDAISAHAPLIPVAEPLDFQFTGPRNVL